MMSRTMLVLLAACACFSGCASSAAKSGPPPFAAASCPAGTVKYCDRRSQAGCQCVTKQDVESVKALFY